MNLIFSVVIFSLLALHATIDPYDKAKTLVKQMTLKEKLTILSGIPGDYIGNTGTITRLNIQSIHLEDGPQGVADNVSQVTCYPSFLSMMSTWNRDLMQEYGKHIGQEQYDKGTHVHLGPMMNLARVPKGGRNFESVGEDPYLASEMIKPYIIGIQNQDVIACAKHWVNNEQEIDRLTSTSEVDERTNHEMYYPPFEAAVQAEVGSFMCAYNKVNGTYACENQQTMTKELRNRWHFRGWMMSDWGATHSTGSSIMAGLDMEMGDDEYFKHIEEFIQNGQIPVERVDEMAERILSQLIKYNILDNPKRGNITDNVRNEKHTEYALHAAEESYILLKNDDGILPMNIDFSVSPIKSIAIIGEVANSTKYVSGGGSGNVISQYTITPLEGIIKATRDKDISVYYSDGIKNTSDALVIANKSDVVIFFSGAHATEGRDRANLNLINNDDALISQISQVNKNLIVVLHIPGTILMPWIHDIKACLVSLFPGEQTGNAIANILFGYVNPSGKLPISMPIHEHDTWLVNKEQYPGVNLTVKYTEKLLIGYRWFDTYLVKPLFPFGHGLSYTSFTYKRLNIGVTRELDKIMVMFILGNSGNYTGKEVTQLYIGYPRASGEPPKVLRGFQKIELKSEEETLVVFQLYSRDFSIWDVAADNWKQETGVFRFYVGSSANDIRLSQEFEVPELTQVMRKKLNLKTTLF